MTKQDLMKFDKEVLATALLESLQANAWKDMRIASEEEAGKQALKLYNDTCERSLQYQEKLTRIDEFLDQELDYWNTEAKNALDKYASAEDKEEKAYYETMYRKYKVRSSEVHCIINRLLAF